LEILNVFQLCAALAERLPAQVCMPVDSQLMSGSYRLKEARRVTLTEAASQGHKQAAQVIAALQQEQEALAAQNDMLNTEARTLRMHVSDLEIALRKTKDEHQHEQERSQEAFRASEFQRLDDQQRSQEASRLERERWVKEKSQLQVCANSALLLSIVFSLASCIKPALGAVGRRRSAQGTRSCMCQWLHTVLLLCCFSEYWLTMSGADITDRANRGTAGKPTVCVRSRERLAYGECRESPTKPSEAGTDFVMVCLPSLCHRMQE
jgi:hypothetical protein